MNINEIGVHITWKLWENQIHIFLKRWRTLRKSRYLLIYLFLLKRSTVIQMLLFLRFILYVCLARPRSKFHMYTDGYIKFSWMFWIYTIIWKRHVFMHKLYCYFKNSFHHFRKLSFFINDDSSIRITNEVMLHKIVLYHHFHFSESCKGKRKRVKCAHIFYKVIHEINWTSEY